MASLRVATWNINGLAPNVEDAQTMMILNKIDILLVSETHCTKNSNIKIKHHSVYHTNHPDGTGHGGTAIIIRRNIKHHLLPEYKTNHIQATTISVEDKCGYFNVSSIYCPPKHTISETMFTDFFLTLGSRFISGGDWNAKHTHWGSRLTSPRGRQLKKTVDDNHLVTISSNEPTYWPSDPNRKPDLVDFFVIKGLASNYFKAEPCFDSSSDHTPVILTVSTLAIENYCQDSLCNKYTDWNSFREYIDEKTNLSVPIKTPEDIEEQTRYITSLIQTSCWINTPIDNNNKYRTRNLPLEIRNKIQEKRRLRRVWHNSRNSSDKTAFNKAIVELRVMIKNANNEIIEKKMSTLSATVTNDYSLWKFMKSHNKPQTANLPLKWDNKWTRTSEEKAQLFAEHLSNVFTPNPASDINIENTINEVLEQAFQLDPPLKPISPNEIKRCIRNLKDKKSPGYDLITKEILKELPKKGIVYIAKLFNAVIRIQYIPLQWKVSQIIMVHKPGKPGHEVSSYRPISLLPIMSKLFERVFLQRILPELKEKDIIPNHQFGFREQHSTVEQVHRVYDTIRSSFENKQYCSSVFLDIQQAFDKVWHKGLLFKIKRSLSHNFYPLLKSYLEDRIFQVRENGATSKFYELKAGVPQGSVLGPILYSLYTADLPEVEEVTIATFADDTAIMSSNSNPKLASETLQRGLEKISEWMNNWRIKASSTKSVQVTFTLRRGNCPPVKLGGNYLPHNETVRYLGLHLDRRLTWQTHIKKKRDEMNLKFRNLSWILGRNSKLSTDNKLLIYKAILKPIWMYGIQLWGCTSNSNISMLQRAQNMMLKSISSAPWFITNTEIHEHLQMSTVKEEIRFTAAKYKKRLEDHPNHLAKKLAQRTYQKRLKRADIQTLDQRD